VAERGSTASGRIAVAAVLDTACVLVFVVVGRRSHGEQLNIGGVFQTLWPFFTSLVLGWLVTLAWRTPLNVRWPGIPVWIVTVAGGMAFRAAFMQGVELSFVIVAAIVLGIFLLGWRGVAYALVRPRRRVTV
jgi:Protein of unknown function (DUF3054)